MGFGRGGPEATVDALMSVTPYFRITAPKAKDILRQVEAAVAQWRDQGRAFGLTDVELDQFADAFEHHERAAARRAIGIAARQRFLRRDHVMLPHGAALDAAYEVYDEVYDSV